MFLYTYAAHEEETDLALLELRCLFNLSPRGGIILDAGGEAVSPSRSPFIKRRVEASAVADRLDQPGGLLEQLTRIDLKERTFKVVFSGSDERFTYEEKRQLERMTGGAIRGKADMRAPDAVFGLIRLEGMWYFGPCEDNEGLWLKHQGKPHNYSTALNTRSARAIVNIAAGRQLEGMRMIDPCCGIGTVLIEALSMGIIIEGFDINPLAAQGARQNLAHFGFANCIQLADMRDLKGSYDSAVLDMPYNLCSVLPEEEALEMLCSVRRLAKRAVIVTTLPMERQLKAADWVIVDQAQARKGSFTRYVTVVE